MLSDLTVYDELFFWQNLLCGKRKLVITVDVYNTNRDAGTISVPSNFSFGSFNKSPVNYVFNFSFSLSRLRPGISFDQHKPFRRVWISDQIFFVFLVRVIDDSM